MSTVSERIKDTFSTARHQLEGFEKTFGKKVGQFEKQVGKLEKRAKASLDEVPAQLRGAWTQVRARLQGALAYATRDELQTVSERVDDLARKVDKLLRGDKIRDAAKKKA